MKNPKNTLDTIFSKFIRLRDSDEQGICKCITCKKMFSWNNIHNGHFISRRHEATRYDEENCNSQCAYCNTFNQGEQYKYSVALDIKYGKGTAEKLENKSRMFCQRKRHDYLVMIQHYKEKVKILLNSKGL